MEPTDATTSVVIVTHQSADLIGEVLTALGTAACAPDEIIVVDSASSDGTRTVLDGFDVRRVDLDENVGFAAGCRAGAALATGSVLVFLGHDSIPEPHWLDPLVEAVLDEGIGAAMSTLVEVDDPSRFNTSGGHLSYVGLAWISGYRDPIPDDEPELTDVAFPSGSAMAIRREAWIRFDGFRDDLFMYLEDVDLGWRLRLAGLRVVRSSRSRVRHRYDFARTGAKMFWLERNRWLVLASNYRPATIAALAPALVVTEAGVWFVAVRDRWFGAKVRAMRDAGRAMRRGASRRAAVDRLRVVGDGAMLATMESSISTVRQVRAPRGSGFVDAILGTWLRIALPIIRITDRW
jgi:GT2 family glycosyltransferase